MADRGRWSERGEKSVGSRVVVIWGDVKMRSSACLWFSIDCSFHVGELGTVICRLHFLVKLSSDLVSGVSSREWGSMLKSPARMIRGLLWSLVMLMMCSSSLSKKSL